MVLWARTRVHQLATCTKPFNVQPRTKGCNRCRPHAANSTHYQALTIPSQEQSLQLGTAFEALLNPLRQVLSL